MSCPPHLCILSRRTHAFKGIVIAGLVKLNLIHEMGGWTTDNVEKGLQDLLVCVEMLVIAIAHTTAFSSKPYEDGTTLRDGASLLEVHFAHHSAIRDFNEVSSRWVALESGGGVGKLCIRYASSSKRD